MRHERRAICSSVLDEHRAQGWTVVHAHSQPMRGTDVLVERFSSEHVDGSCVPVSRDAYARLDAYATAIGSSPQSVVEGWIASRVLP